MPAEAPKIRLKAAGNLVPRQVVTTTDDFTGASGINWDHNGSSSGIIYGNAISGSQSYSGSSLNTLFTQAKV